MATVQRYVNTASSGGDGTTNNTSGGTAAYASLSSWEANAGGSATDDYVVDCCGTAADTTAVTIDFAVNLTTGTATIRANAGDGAGKYNGTALISTSHYRLAPTGSVSALTLAEQATTIDGLQIECQGGSFRAGILFSNLGGTTYAIRNCRVRASGTCDVGIGCADAGQASNGTITVENNIVVGFNLRQIEYIADNFRTPTMHIRHNTLYGDGSSVGIKIANTGSNSGATYNVKANAIGNTGASNCFDITTVGGGTVTYDDNATEDAQGTTGEIAIGTLANAWTSPGTGQSADFTVKNTSSTLYSAVNPTLISTDITGYTRDGTNHDVGALELQSSGTTIPVGAGSATLTGLAPTAAVTSSGLAQPGVGACAITGQTPTVVLTAHVVSQPSAGALALTGGAPTAVRTGSFVTEALINNTGTVLSEEDVVWSWYPGGRVGSLDAITPVDGAGTTEVDGTLIVVGLTLGAGLLLVAAPNTSAEDDAVYYEAGAVT